MSQENLSLEEMTKLARKVTFWEEIPRDGTVGTTYRGTIGRAYVEVSNDLVPGDAYESTSVFKPSIRVYNDVNRDSSVRKCVGACRDKSLYSLFDEIQENIKARLYVDRTDLIRETRALLD